MRMGFAFVGDREYVLGVYGVYFVEDPNILEVLQKGMEASRTSTYNKNIGVTLYIIGDGKKYVLVQMYTSQSIWPDGLPATVANTVGKVGSVFIVDDEAMIEQAHKLLDHAQQVLTA